MNKQHKLLRGAVLTAILAVSQMAFAQVSFNIRIGPPASIVEPMPILQPGYVWAPGYWAWHGDRHIWMHGRAIMQRPGYQWQPDVWEERNDRYYRHPGRWGREDGPGNGRGPHGRQRDGRN